MNREWYIALRYPRDFCIKRANTKIKIYPFTILPVLILQFGDEWDSNFLIFSTSTPLSLHYTKLLLIPCHAPTTPVTKVPAITIALGPFVLLNMAPAKNPDT